jgi:hypothetical protein
MAVKVYVRALKLNIMMKKLNAALLALPDVKDLTLKKLTNIYAQSVYRYVTLLKRKMLKMLKMLMRTTWSNVAKTIATRHVDAEEI